MGDRAGQWSGRITALATLAVATGLLLAPVPTRWLGLWSGQFLDFGHVPLFAALVLALRFELGAPLWRPLAVAIGFAGLVEVVQPFVGRSGDPLDFVRGALGALAGAALVRAWEARRERGRVLAYIVLALALVFGPIVEVTPYVVDTVTGNREFPVLATFSTDHELRRWELTQATLARTEAGGRLDFLTGPADYPGAALRPMVGDFSAYRWLCYEFEVAGEPLELATSVRTGTAGSHTTQIGASQRYPSGTHVARLDLVAGAPRGRPDPLDLSDVRMVIVFMVRPQESRAILLKRVWLEP